MSDEISQKDTKLLIKPDLQKAFYLRMMGLTYDEIATDTGYTAGYLRHAFAKGGVMYEEWQRFKILAEEQGVEETLAMAYGHLPDIMRANIIDAKKLDSMIAIMARQMIFKMTTMEKPKQVDIRGNLIIGTVADYTRAIYEQRAKDNQQSAGAA